MFIIMGTSNEKNRLRRKRITLRLSDYEYMMLEQKAYEFNITVTEFLRQIILFGGVQKTKPRIDEDMIADLIREINYIGNNINQIAYNTNVLYYTSLEDLKMAKEEAMKVSRLLYNCLRNIEESDKRT